MGFWQLVYFYGKSKIDWAYVIGGTGELSITYMWKIGRLLDLFWAIFVICLIESPNFYRLVV